MRGRPERQLLRPLAGALLVALLLLPVAGALAGLPVSVGEGRERPAASGTGAPDADSAAAAAAAAEYLVRFRCPERVDAPTLDQGPVCPDYVLDEEDVFGQPALMVDPRNPSFIAFSAMHGGHGIHPPGQEPPSERSRSDPVHQPHTTFASKDGGASWVDQPYHAPDAMQREGAGGQRTRDIFGEDNAAVQDAQGRMYLAALYAYRDGAGGLAAPGAFQYAVALWKAKGPEYPVDYHVNTRIIDSGNEGADRIDGLHLEHVPATDLVVVVWREETPDALGGDGANASRVVLHATQPGGGALWERAAVDIAPCARMSNPVAVDAFLYVACRADADDGNDTVRVHEVDTASWTARVAGEAQVAGSTLHLVKRGAFGHMVLVGSGLDGDLAPLVQVAYGERGGAWGPAEDIGHRLASGSTLPLLDARVTAAAYAPRSGNLHVIYLERYDLRSANADTGQTPEFAKFFGSMVAEGRFLELVDLGVGTASRLGFSPVLTGAGSGVFDDLHDSIVIWDGAPHGLEDREFVAFGDHGYVRFAEVVEENFTPPMPLAFTNVPPVPFASPGAAPAVLGVGAGVLAGAFVARTIAARRAAALEVGAE